MKPSTINYVRKLIAAQLAHLSGELAKDSTDAEAATRIMFEMNGAQQALVDLLTPAEETVQNPAAQTVFDTVAMNKRTIGEIAQAAEQDARESFQRGAKILKTVVRLTDARIGEDLEAILRNGSSTTVERAGDLVRNGRHPVIQEVPEPNRPKSIDDFRKAEREAAAS